MEVKVISASLAREVVEREHYLRRKPTVSFSFGLYDELNLLMGVCTYGNPAGGTVRKSASPLHHEAVVELNRLWVHDSMPRNTESWFVAQTLKALPPRIVVSYADTGYGHMGYIYRALNFYYAGWTDMDRDFHCYDYFYTPNPLTWEKGDSYTYSSEKKKWNLKVLRKPKVRYWITTGTRTERKLLEKFCAWPKMNWQKEPPPVHHISLKSYRDKMTRGELINDESVYDTTFIFDTAGTRTVRKEIRTALPGKIGS